MSEEADTLQITAWLWPTTAMRTVCVVAKRSPDRQSIGSVRDADTASCRAAPFGHAKAAQADGHFDLTPMPVGPPIDMFATDMFAGQLSRTFDAERLAQAFAAKPFFQVHPASEDR